MAVSSPIQRRRRLRSSRWRPTAARSSAPTPTECSSCLSPLLPYQWLTPLTPTPTGHRLRLCDCSRPPARLRLSLATANSRCRKTRRSSCCASRTRSRSRRSSRRRLPRRQCNKRRRRPQRRQCRRHAVTLVSAAAQRSRSRSESSRTVQQIVRPKTLRPRNRNRRRGPTGRPGVRLSVSKEVALLLNLIHSAPSGSLIRD